MISIEYKKGLPLEYESFLIERYDSFISTCRYVEVYYSSYEMSHLLVYRDGSLIELLLLGSKGDTTTCFNALVKLPQSIMEKCISKIFEISPNIYRIKIDASYALSFRDKAMVSPPKRKTTRRLAIKTSTRKLNLKSMIRLTKKLDGWCDMNLYLSGISSEKI